MKDRQVLQMKDGEIINTYKTVSDAARAINISRSVISECLSLKMPRAGKFEWMYRREMYPASKVCVSEDCKFKGEHQPIEDFAKVREAAGGKSKKCKSCLELLGKNMTGVDKIKDLDEEEEGWLIDDLKYKIDDRGRVLIKLSNDWMTSTTSKEELMITVNNHMAKHHAQT